MPLPFVLSEHIHLPSLSQEAGLASPSGKRRGLRKGLASALPPSLPPPVLALSGDPPVIGGQVIGGRGPAWADRY